MSAVVTAVSSGFKVKGYPALVATLELFARLSFAVLTEVAGLSIDLAFLCRPLWGGGVMRKRMSEQRDCC